MKRISTVLEAWLVAQGMSAGSLAGDDAQGMDAGVPEGTAHPLAARPGEDREPMGMRKTRATKARASRQETLEAHRFGKGRSPILEVHVNPNMTDMAMRQTTHAPRAVAPRGVVSLMAIEGGKR